MRIVLALACFCLALSACDRDAGESERAEGASAHASPSAMPFDAGVVLESEEAAGLDLGLAALAEATWSPTRTAYGVVVEDPARRCELRAPLAGVLAPGEATPALGEVVAAGAVVMRLAPRWTAVELADLAARRVAARTELATAEAEVPALRSELERARQLNANGKSVSDKELQEIEARVRTSEARIAGARELAAALEHPPEALTLSLPCGGTVVDVRARAGESVEAGAALLVIADLTTPLIAIELPFDGGVPLDVATARVSPGGAPDPGIPAERIGMAPDAGGAGLAPRVLFRVRAGTPGAERLRPGLRVAAELPTGEAARTGRVVPRAAVVQLAGRSFAYVRRSADAFERVNLDTSAPLDAGWFVAADWGRAADGAAPEVVVQGAGALLSLELLGRQGGEEE